MEKIKLSTIQATFANDRFAKAQELALEARKIIDNTQLLLAQELGIPAGQKVKVVVEDDNVYLTVEPSDQTDVSHSEITETESDVTDSD